MAPLGENRCHLGEKDGTVLVIESRRVHRHVCIDNIPKDGKDQPPLEKRGSIEKTNRWKTETTSKDYPQK